MITRLATVLSATTLLASLVGCADSDPCNSDGVIEMTYAPGDYTSEEAAVLDGAAPTWNAFAGREVLRVTRREGGGTCAIVKDGQWGTGKAHLARTDKPLGILQIGTSLDCKITTFTGVECFKLVATHELGHMLGLHHVDDPRALMFKGPNTTTPTDADRPQCEHEGVCVVAPGQQP